MVQRVKDLGLPLLWLGSQLWRGFDPSPRNFCTTPPPKKLLLCMPAGMSEAEEACLWGVSQHSGPWRPSRGARAAD